MEKAKRESTCSLDRDGIYNLAGAILNRAVLDYKSALRGKAPAAAMISGPEQMERFFRSDYGQVLSFGHGEEIIRMCRKEIET